jgi:hypothetical protein
MDTLTNVRIDLHCARADVWVVQDMCLRDELLGRRGRLRGFCCASHVDEPLGARQIDKPLGALLLDYRHVHVRSSTALLHVLHYCRGV